MTHDDRRIRHVVRIYVDGDHAVTVFADQPCSVEKWLPADAERHSVHIVVAPLSEGDDPVATQ